MQYVLVVFCCLEPSLKIFRYYCTGSEAPASSRHESMAIPKLPFQAEHANYSPSLFKA